MREKRRTILYCLILSLIIILPMISAQYGSGNYFYNAQGTIRPVLDSALGIMAPILEFAVGDYSTSGFFAVKVLFLILLIAIIVSVLKSIPRFEEMNDSTLNVIAVIVSILAVRFIGENNLIVGILLPYGTLGSAILLMLPFILWFYFIHQSNMGSGMRKFSWGFFMMIFFIFWNSRFPYMGSIANQIYTWGFFLFIIVLIFDRSIHRYFKDAESKRHRDTVYDAEASRLQEEYQRISTVDTQESRRRMRWIIRRLKTLGRRTSNRS